MRMTPRHAVLLPLWVAVLSASCGGGQEPPPLDLGGVSLAADGAVILGAPPPLASDLDLLQPVALDSRTLP